GSNLDCGTDGKGSICIYLCEHPADGILNDDCIARRWLKVQVKPEFEIRLLNRPRCGSDRYERVRGQVENIIDGRPRLYLWRNIHLVKCVNRVVAIIADKYKLLFLDHAG